jgi:hypothetical protein
LILIIDNIFIELKIMINFMPATLFLYIECFNRENFIGFFVINVVSIGNQWVINFNYKNLGNSFAEMTKLAVEIYARL